MTSPRDPFTALEEEIPVLTRSQMPRGLRDYRLRRRPHAVVIAAAIALQHDRPDASVGLVLADRRGRLRLVVDLVDAHERRVPELATMMARAVPWWPRLGLLVVTTRPVLPDDILDLELIWEEAAAAVRGSRLRLLDWIVIAEGRTAFSVAEFTPTPPAWPRVGVC